METTDTVTEVDGLALVTPDFAPQRPTYGTRVKHRRVLVVDDDPHLRALLALTLERVGYRVEEASDGMAAVEHLASAHGRVGSKFSAIIADVYMPGLSGLDVLTVLQCASVHIPVILVTAFPDVDLRAEAQLLGAAAVFAKPLDVEALTTALAVAVSRKPQVHSA